MRGTGRLGLACVSAVAVAAMSSPARGQSPHTVIVCVEGPESEAIAARLVARIGRDRAETGDAACRGVEPAGAKDRRAVAKLIARTRAAVRAAHADMAVVASVSHGKRHVWLVDAKGAQVDRELTLHANASADEEAEAVWASVSAEIPSSASVADASSNGASPAAPSTPTPARDATAPPDTAVKPEPPASPPGDPPAGDIDHGISSDTTSSAARWAHALAFLRASMEVGSRDFSYVDRLTSTLRSYSLFAAPLARVDGELYPLARTGIPIVEGLGVTADYAMAFGLSSSDGSDASGSVGTSWSRFDAGLRERIPLGRAVLVGLHGGYGQILYSFSGAQGTTAQVPGVDYQFVSGGADARVTWGATSVAVSGSYLGVLGTGPVASYFPRATVGGVEACAGVTQAFGPGLQLSLELAYTRFFYTLNPEPGDAYVAGGALDQMVTGSIGVGYLL